METKILHHLPRHYLQGCWSSYHLLHFGPDSHLKYFITHLYRHSISEYDFPLPFKCLQALKD